MTFPSGMFNISTNEFLKALESRFKQINYKLNKENHSYGMIADTKRLIASQFGNVMNRKSQPSEILNYQKSLNLDK